MLIIKDVTIFDQQLVKIFPRCNNLLVELWDQQSVMNILADLIGSGANLQVTFPIGKFTRKAAQIIPEQANTILADSQNKTAYRVGPLLKGMAARFGSHPLHNFFRIYYDGLSGSDTGRKLAVKEPSSEVEIKVRDVLKPGWMVVYPAGSLFSDQRLEKRVRDLAVSGKEASLFDEFMAVDRENPEKETVELINYVPEDAKLWEQWFSKMDTNMFQTVMQPSNFKSTQGQADDYSLKIILYGKKKVGAVWLEKINQRNGTAELGLLIGEPQLWGLGLGNKAMNAMIEIAKKELGLRFLWVSVREANQRAVNCYKRGGFFMVRKVPVFHKTDGSYQIWVHMEKMI